ncbi:MAG: hypothetical protein MUF87_14510 [Anaerolineae bacterium]|jgi:hypothetical protein|nr:hypothetical protein [Anaerolineae bacterium]
MADRRKISAERLAQKIAQQLRDLIKATDDPIMKQRYSDMLDDLLDMQYQFEERLKTSMKTWGGKYGFLPSGVTDYLDDDFDDDDDQEKR